MTPSATEARPEVSLARKPAPGVLPTPMPTNIGQNRRNSARSFRPASACHTLVLKFGTTSNPAAWPGAITRVKRPVATVGSPMPIKPLTKPANRNDPNATRRTGNDSPINAAFLVCGDGACLFEPQASLPDKRTGGRRVRNRPNCRGGGRDPSQFLCGRSSDFPPPASANRATRRCLLEASLLLQPGGLGGLVPLGGLGDEVAGELFGAAADEVEPL